MFMTTTDPRQQPTPEVQLTQTTDPRGRSKTDNPRGRFAHPWVTSTAGRLRVVGGTLMYSAVVSGLRLIWLWPIQNVEENVEGGQEA